MTTALPPGSVGQPKRRVLGFSPDSTVDVRQVSDEALTSMTGVLSSASNW